ncbi:WecB/TagA/CpsF family glycosyltransferase [Paraglaciecola hydrolytica]|uniref:Glycosyl transferase n=1 Tax=Paraglaciecola hydrolytica TaxID=1799789 RepID=A0A148KLM3_9ALTE|nr:WecB/TagA/CpsF family glycosyltransferase [Paraglaciecola hydrolytica]KXI27223.1 hypothetical protein AX660_21050 [Paraglaciecola hydrolytica]
MEEIVMTHFLGLNISDVPIEKVIDKLFSGEFSNKILVTPNVDHIVRYHKEPSFREVYDKADIYLNDSRILKLLSNNKIHNVVPGSDLTQCIFERLDTEKKNVVIIGATENDILAVKEKYRTRTITHIEPSFGFINRPDEITSIVTKCLTYPNSLYFVCVGSPQQEKLALALRDAGVKGEFLCVGASILFLSGAEKRAPKIIQKLSLEWAFRLLQSPKRLWKRYLIDGPYIFILVLRHSFRRK